jgi:hypothetical protein
MKLLDALTVASANQQHRIELYQGDLTNMPPEQAVDVMVVSAFPNVYAARSDTLIGALARRNIDVSYLAETKAIDLRESFSCWISQEISAGLPGIQFKRLLCFEPREQGNAPEIVGDIFRSLMPFVYGPKPITSIAMPLVATGKQRVSVATMLDSLVDAAYHWLAMGLPVKTIKIVEFNEAKAEELKAAFGRLKQKYPAHTQPMVEPEKPFKYDFFISYSHQNVDEVMLLHDELLALKPTLKIFIDRTHLNTGSAWQQELYEALDECRKVIVVYSPPYLTSKVCKEEFNIALLRHREADGNVLVPIYLYSAQLPTYMQLIQFIDCREGDAAKIKAACRRLVG